MKKLKYNNKKTIVDGITFDSKKEAARYSQLKLLERANKISDLKLQVMFTLAPSVKVQKRKRPPLVYIADFVYTENNSKVVEDCKGVRTEGYRIKRHLLMATHGIEILET